MINILGICDTAEILSVIRLIRIVINAIQIIVPIVLIVTLSLDFSRATFTHDDNALIQARNKAVFKAIAAVCIFAIPTFVNVLMKASINDDTYKTCLQSATQENIDLAFEARADRYMTNARNSLTRETYTFAKNNLKYVKDETKKQKDQRLS